jgi:hypothetical protein
MHADKANANKPKISPTELKRGEAEWQRCREEERRFQFVKKKFI